MLFFLFLLLLKIVFLWFRWDVWAHCHAAEFGTSRSSSLQRMDEKKLNIRGALNFSLYTSHSDVCHREPLYLWTLRIDFHLSFSLVYKWLLTFSAHPLQRAQYPAVTHLAVTHKQHPMCYDLSKGHKNYISGAGETLKLHFSVFSRHPYQEWLTMSAWVE